MIRKTIKTNNEMPDSILLKEDIAIKELQNAMRAGDRKSMLLTQVASLSKRLINEGVAFEDLLSQPGMVNVSAALYSLEWSVIYYQAVEDRRKRQERGYWKCLLDALLNL